MSSFPNSRKTTELPFLPAAQIADGDVFHIVDVSVNRSKQTTVADLAAAIGGVIGSGTVTSVSVVTANGVSGTVATPTTTPAITIILGNIVPTSVNSIVFTGASTPTLLVTGTSSISNANTGDQTFTASGDATAPGSTSNLALTLATITTADTTGGSTAIPVVTKDVKGRVTGITTAAVIAPAGTLSGATLNATVVNSSLQKLGIINTGVWQGTAVTVGFGGTGDTSFTPYAVVTGGTTSTGNLQQVASLGSSGQVLTSQGAGALPQWSSIAISLTGDVTGGPTSGSMATTISNDAVTYAKMQNVSAQFRVLGRKSVGAGDTEECTLSEVLDFIGSAAQGDILYRGATTWARLGAGTSGQFLQTQGASANPQWAGVTGASGGTVTSVAISGTNGLSVVSGSPITTAGTIALTIGNVGGVTPVTVNGLTITPSTGTLTVLDGKVATINNALTFNGTDGSAVQFSQGGTVIYTTNKLSDLSATNSLELKSVISDETGNGLLVFNDTPTILTPVITAPTITGGTHTALTKLGIRSIGTGAFDLVIKNTENLTAERNLTVVMGDQDRTLTFAGNATISNVNSGDQTFTASGDATAPGSQSNLALTLATVNSNVGAFGSSTAIPTVTVNAKGLVTAVSTNAVIAPAGTLTGTTLAGNVVSSSLTSVGTLTAGVWHASIIPVQYGGTGADLSATGGTSRVVMQTSTGASFTVAQLAASDLSNGTTGTGAVVLQTGPTMANPTALVSLDVAGGAAQIINFNHYSGTTTGVIRAPSGSGDSLSIQAYDGSVYQNLFTATSGSGSVTGDLQTAVTIGGQYIYRVGGTDVSVADGGTGVSSFTPYAVICGGTTSAGALQSVAGVGTSGQVLVSNGPGTLPTFQTIATGGGTVTSVAVAVNQGITLSGSPITSSGTIMLGLGNITPTTVNGLTISTTTGTLTVTNGKTLTVSLDASVSNTNTGDQTFTASGDATAPGSTSNLVLTLATVNSNVGSFGSSTAIPTVTVNAKGLVTAVSTNAVIAPAGTLTGTALASNVVTSSLTSVGTLTGGATGAGFTVALSTSTITGTLPAANMPALTGDVTTTVGTVATTLATVATAGTTGSSTAIPVITIDAKGRTTSITTAAVVAPAGTLTGTTLASNVVNSSLTTLGTVTSGTWNASTVGVAYGGTGDTSFTAYAVVCGGTTATGPLQQVSGLGTTGQVLTSQGAGALPTWTTVSTGSGTVTSVAVTAHQGIGVTGSPITTSGTIDLTLGDITPTSVVTNTGKVRSGGPGANGVLAVWDNANSREITLTGGNAVMTLGGTGNPSLSLASNLLLPSGGEINWNGGDVKFTHSSNLLTLSGGDLALGSQTIISGNWNGSTIAVAYGGTGKISFTAYAPICGGTASGNPLQSASTGQGTSGNVFSSKGSSALPEFVTFSSLMNAWKSTVTGWSSSVRQFLTHDSSGNFEWKNTFTGC